MPKNDDKTEQPTAKRRAESRRDGHVARSQDLSGWIIVLTGVELIPRMFRSAYSRLVKLFASVSQVITDPQPGSALHVFSIGMRDAADIVLPNLAILAAVGLAVNMAQTRGLFSFKAAAPRFDRLNPISGVKKLFSAQSLWQLGKQVARLSVLVVVAYVIVSRLGRNLVGSRPADLTPVLAYSGSTILGLARDVAALGIILSFADYAWQRHTLNKTLKMTKQEVKDENRQSQGDPVIKGKIRGEQRRLSRARMMAAVLGADVVVTNPTHFAVALRYEAGTGKAPTVVAKGADEMAFRIRDHARNHKIPVLEDAPLARAIYAVCEVDQAIPHDLYMAVARVLAFVFTLPAVVKAAGLVHRRPFSALIA